MLQHLKRSLAKIYLFSKKEPESVISDSGQLFELQYIKAYYNLNLKPASRCSWKGWSVRMLNGWLLSK